MPRFLLLSYIVAGILFGMFAVAVAPYVQAEIEAAEARAEVRPSIARAN
jgi:hypothetical protein